MIVVELAGGLGNQCFQYAAARTAADRLGVDLGLDLRSCRGEDSRPYGLGRFRIRATIVPDADLFGVHGPRSWRRELTTGLVTRAASLVLRPAFRGVTRIVHQEPSWSDVLTRLSDPSWLCGYWQSERYFAGNAAQIREDLTLTTMSPETAALQRTIQSMSFPVAVHVRRGDYAAIASTRAFHGLCEPEYYRTAIREIRARHPEAQFIFLSDEPGWVAEHLREEADLIVTGNGDARPQEDLHVMTRCRAHIIANSTFSWWGAWLADSALVIAPRRWFQATGVDERDIVPARWMRL